MKNKVYLIVFIVLAVIGVSNGLKCYACSSSASIYDAACDAGSTNVRSGLCPTNTKYYCVVRRTNNTMNGTSTVLRDCSSKPDSTLDYSCTSDLCNSSSTFSSRGQGSWILTFGFIFLYYSGMSF